MLTSIAPRLVAFARDVIGFLDDWLDDFDLYVDRWAEHLGIDEPTDDDAKPWPPSFFSYWHEPNNDGNWERVPPACPEPDCVMDHS